MLSVALDIAGSERGVDRDVLICACILHDIARAEQDADPSVDHALHGAEKAAAFLSGSYPDAFTQKVCDCIRTHRFRSDAPPQSLEAKILFDADKIDAAGAIGIARTLLYNALHGEPIYSLSPDGQVLDGTENSPPSFFNEYKRKLEGLYDGFYTQRGKEIAQGRQGTARAFYAGLLAEMRESHRPEGEMG